MIDSLLSDKIAKAKALGEALESSNTLKEAIEWYAEEYEYTEVEAQEIVINTISELLKTNL